MNLSDSLTNAGRAPGRPNKPRASSGDNAPYSARGGRQ